MPELNVFNVLECFVEKKIEHVDKYITQHLVHTNFLELPLIITDYIHKWLLHDFFLKSLSDVKQMDLSYIAGGNVKWYTHFGKQNWQLLNVYSAYDKAVPLLCI